ncbi:sulfurtransferase complex subunit TusB [Actinobacillus arthritidis]|uniref:sulfurtransferase complex subunit TusB n=1 Tax=Actinobacillus arthritidis TaxID=157339 RepID=UPI00244330B9|nr:sulfurtransferase complex subunit TusB [Actinobacillus arthritidis]WGE89132.1 sulfurtransferase complex subunit TusB [Actinobacillus arthritidis]
MLYTFSKAQYELTELNQILSQMTENDAVVLWQDGVLLAVKYPQLFTKVNNIFLLSNDIEARGLTILNYQSISLSDLINITEKYHPQIAL